MDRAWRGVVGELDDGGHDPAPHRHRTVVAGGGEFVGTPGAFLERLVAAAIEHELRRSPNVNLGYHTEKLRDCRR